jgi:hypothetical protein
MYAAEKAAYLAQATITHAIIAALNIAIPKQFKRGTTALGGAIIGSASYRSNHDPRTILLSLCTTYSIPTPAERQVNDTAFAAPWNSNDPIETFFDCLEDCYVAAIITTPPFTLDQMINRAIMSIQLTSLYSQALINWNAIAPATRTGCWLLEQHRFSQCMARTLPHLTQCTAGLIGTGTLDLRMLEWVLLVVVKWLEHQVSCCMAEPPGNWISQCMGTKLYLNPQLFDVLLCLTMVLLAGTLLGLNIRSAHLEVSHYIYTPLLL